MFSESLHKRELITGITLIYCLLSCGRDYNGFISPEDNEKVSDIFRRGYQLNYTGKYDSARIVLHEAFEIKDGEKWDGGRILVNIANSYLYQEEYVNALKWYFKALRIAETGTDEYWAPVQASRAMCNISECYYLIGNQGQALHYASIANDLLLQVDSNCYLRPQALYVMGSVYLAHGEYEEAEQKMSEALTVSDYYVDKDTATAMYWYKAYGEEGLSKVYLARNDIQKAEDYAHRSIKSAEVYGDPAVTAKCLLALSDVYLQQKKYTQSRETALKALAVSAEAIRLNPSLAFNIAASCLFLGEKETAYEYFRIYSEQMKKNTDRNFRVTLASMDMQYETEKKELRIAALERERILLLGLVLVVCLLAVSLIFLWKQRMRRLREEKSLAEMKAATKGIMEGEIRERERISTELHDGIQGLLTAVNLNLDNPAKIRSLTDKAIEEIHSIVRDLSSKILNEFGLRAAVEDYCSAFPSVTFVFYGDNRRLPEHIEIIVYRCMQELVTNSIKYAEAENISVDLLIEPARVMLTVFDNGKGFDVTNALKGNGIANLRHRMDAVNGKMDISSSPENGTETVIEIKYSNPT